MSDDLLKYLTGYTGRKDKRRPHARIFADMYYSPAFLALSPTARCIYLGMLINSGGSPTFELPYRKFCPKVCSRQTFKTAVEQLEKHGFITKKRNYAFESTQYSLSDNWMKEQPKEKVKHGNDEMKDHHKARSP